ncbi:MAG: B12-binding domain-containing radical SAM protein [Nanoarchaeota archaeon]|nr:B12-binding domain-containing radical SAM protein [Nanoarchaeota archaeon]MBU0962505.1 B12-binding domain-containing radical SAM protein [Nanoarchaeota archaeon]
MKFLLINPPSSIKIYKTGKLKAAVSEMPLISLASLAAVLEQEKVDTQVLDLSTSLDPLKDLSEKLQEFNPEYLGVTFTTPLYNEAKEIANMAKNYNKKIITIAGGVHPSALPRETLEETKFDIVVLGEGEVTLKELIKSKHLKDIKGIGYKDKEEIKINPRRELIKDLDTLPLPAWHLFDLKKYKASKLTTRNQPVGPIETSRGCVYGCTYCNKDIFGRTFRFKSPEKVIKEIEHMLDSGFKEIHIWDDNFSTKLDRAKKICDLIIEKGLNKKFTWVLACGVRCDCIDEEFIRKVKEAGCYSIYLGVETGNPELLKKINKGETLEQIKKAFDLCKKVGIETVAFYMLGLPGETIETMNQTIKFSKELDSDYAKFTITVPFPSTPLFYEWEKQGIIKTKDWSKYNFHSASKVYDHPNLSWDILEKYYHKAYREFYFRPSYLAKRLIKDIKEHRLLTEIYYAFKTFI